MKLKKEINLFNWLLTALLLVAAMVVPSVAWAENTITPSRPANGDGTENNPYQISTAHELYWFAGLVNGTLTDGTVQKKDACAKLTESITVNQSVLDANGGLNSGTFIGWTPIGNDSKKYTGTFDGDGKTISGLYFNNSSTDYVGLFGVNRGTIKNVGIVNSYFKGNNYVGGVCGQNLVGTIESCHNKATIDGSAYVGGVCGQNKGGTIYNCYNKGIVGTSIVADERGSNVGGVCGDNIATYGAATISNCYNVVDDNSNGIIRGDGYVGGVCGSNSGSDFSATITNCYNKVKIDGSTSVGGVCGLNSGNAIIEDCYNTNEISGQQNVGGICGENKGGSIKNSNNEGTISSGYSNSNVGGVCGWNNGGTITGCYNSGVVSGINYVGGVCGWNCVQSGTVTAEATVTSCYNSGKVNGYINVGGVCGYNTEDGKSGTAAVTVTNCYNSGTVTGSDDTGGVCGYNGAVSGTATISNCYNSGNVSNGGGGVCGINSVGNATASSIIKNCYFDKTIFLGNAVSRNIGTIEKVEGKSTAQFQSGEVAWLLNGSTADGTLVWYQKIEGEGTPDDYPVLDSRHGTVRQCTPCTGVYTNKEDTHKEHLFGDDDNGFCHNCGTYEPATLTDGVYQISNAGKLYWFAQQVNSGSSGINAVLTTNITVNTGVLDESGNLVNDVSGFRSWTPIGSTYGNAYTGTFDGGNHTISGLYFNSSSTDYVGLFGINKGTIKNVGIVDSYIEGNCNVGSVCGWNCGGTIQKCHNEGTVIGDNGVGGVCGTNEANENETASITECYNTGNVSGSIVVGGVCGGNNAIVSGAGNATATITGCENKGNVSGSNSVGGVCGQNYAKVGESGTGTAKATITNSHNIETSNVKGESNCIGGVCGYNHVTTGSGTATASITGSYNTSTGTVKGESDYTGGVCGKNEGGIIDGCHSTSNVKGEEYVGGVCGQNISGIIKNSYNEGETKGRSSYSKYIGGVCGDNDDGTIETCHNIGEVNCDSGTNYVGGVCGQNKSGTINKCYNTGRILYQIDYAGGVCGLNDGGTITGCYNTGEVWGKEKVGGVCGWNCVQSGTVTAEATVTSCYNSGKVNGYINVGGVCGYNTDDGKSGTAAVTVTNCYNSGAVSGSDATGGVCGRNGAVLGTATISNCYNSGTVSNGGGGGVCGTNSVGNANADAIIENCYFDNEIFKGNAVSSTGGDIENVEGKSTVQFKSGEVCYLLNGSRSVGTVEEPLMWYQNINSGETTDNYPVLDSSHETVSVHTITLPSSTPHGSIKVYNADNEELPATGNKIIVAQSLPVTIKAIPDVKQDEWGYATKTFTANETDISSGYSGQLSENITIAAEFAFEWLKTDGVEYKVVELGGNKVNVTGADDAISELTIPSTVTSPEGSQLEVVGIAENAFKEHTSLTKVVLPSTLKSIGEYAFSGCSNLTEITFTGSTPPTIASNAFDSNFDGKIKVPAQNIEAYKSAFGESLKDNVFPSQVTVTLSAISCGTIKIYYTNNSEEIQLVDGVFKVDAGREITIKAVPNSGYGFSWMKIDGEQQAGAEVRTTLDHDITISASFYYIIPSVFMYDDVCYEKRWDANYWEEVTVRNLNYFYYDKHYTGDLELPEKVEYYGSYYKVTAINERAFSGSSELRSVVLPSVMNKIGSYAFEGCTGLEKLVVKSPSAATRAATTEPTVPTVDEHAFDDICETAVLYVPENWKEAFKAAPEWRKFFTVKEQREDGTVLAELTMTSTYGGKLTVGEITSESDTRIVKVAEGSSVTVEVTPREGYMLTNLSYDGTDVMDQLVDGKLTLTGISGEKYITAVFGIDTAIGNSGASSQKVYMKDGRIVVEGVAAGEEIFIYNTAGQLLRREVANGERLEIPMTAGQMYIVKIGKQSVKVAPSVSPWGE